MKLYYCYLLSLVVLLLGAVMFISTGSMSVAYFITACIAVPLSCQLSIFQKTRYQDEVLPKISWNGKDNSEVIKDFGVKFRQTSKISLLILVVETIILFHPVLFKQYPFIAALHSMGIWCWRYAGSGWVAFFLIVSLCFLLFEIAKHYEVISAQNYAQKIVDQRRAEIDKENQKIKQEIEEKKKQERIEQEFRDKINALVESYGNVTASITLDSKMFDIKSEIRVFESSKKVQILGKIYSFSDIISCTFSDSPRTIKGKVTAVTTSSNGSTIGRAIVGDVIAGPAGAIIGGTTSKKNTTYHQEPDRTVHDYIVIINVNDLSNPIIRINTKENGKLTNEIVGLMNVIIMRK